MVKRWPNRPVVTSVFSFSSFVCAFRIPFFSAPKVRQLWEIGPSCQHFNVIKECVNQSTSSSKTEHPNACYFSPSRALRWGINSHRRAGSPEQNWPPHLIFAVSNKQHESAASCTTTCTRALWMLFLWAVNTCNWRTVLILAWFPGFLNISGSKGTCLSGTWRLLGLRVVHSSDLLTFVTNMTWHLLAFHLCRRTKKKASLVFLESIFAPIKENL